MSERATNDKWEYRIISLRPDEGREVAENLSHKPGWTGEWMTHQMMFVPECLLRQCKIGRAVDHLGV